MRIGPLELCHGAALQSFLADFAEAGEDDVPAYFAESSWSHQEIVDRLSAWALGESLEEGWVASSTRFLFDGERILGVYNLRHELTDWLRMCGGHVGYSVRPSARRQGHATTLLRDAVEISREIGIYRLLVTCGESNTASARVIVKCGGALLDVVMCEDDRPTRRYWIEIGT